MEINPQAGNKSVIKLTLVASDDGKNYANHLLMRSLIYIMPKENVSS